MAIVEYKNRAYIAYPDDRGRVWVRHPLSAEAFVDTSGTDVRKFDDDGATLKVCALNVIRGYQWDLLKGLPRAVPVQVADVDDPFRGEYLVLLQVGQASVFRMPERRQVYARGWHVDPEMSETEVMNSVRTVFAEYRREGRA